MAASIHDVLRGLRHQNGAMLGRKSAESISTFLDGYAFARREAGDAGDVDFLLTFNDWVRKRFRIESTQGWAKVISFFCNQESEEMQLFWKLYDEYMSRRPRDFQRAKPNGHSSKAKKKIGVH